MYSSVSSLPVPIGLGSNSVRRGGVRPISAAGMVGTTDWLEAVSSIIDSMTAGGSVPTSGHSYTTVSPVLSPLGTVSRQPAVIFPATHPFDVSLKYQAGLSKLDSVSMSISCVCISIGVDLVDFPQTTAVDWPASCVKLVESICHSDRLPFVSVNDGPKLVM